jgi:hypothetical protein
MSGLQSEDIDGSLKTALNDSLKENNRLVSRLESMETEKDALLATLENKDAKNQIILKEN